MPENQTSTSDIMLPALRRRMFAANRTLQRPAYRANRGGHAPGHLRQALLDTLNNYTRNVYWFEPLQEDPDLLIFRDPRKQKHWESMPATHKARWLCGQLWNCSDIVPASTMSDFRDLRTRTYAALVRHLKTEIPAEE
jgi:hypothetical protein